MKKRLFNSLLYCLIFIGIYTPLWGQDYGFIDGAEEFCSFDCPDFHFVPTHPDIIPLEYTWTLNGDYTNTQNGNPVNYCEFGQTGTSGLSYIMVDVSFSDGSIQSDSLLLYIMEFEITTIESYGETCEESIPTGNYDEKVCIGSTVTYCPDLNGQPVWGGWSINGATIATDSCLVMTWEQTGYQIINYYPSWDWCVEPGIYVVNVIDIPTATIGSIPAAENNVISVCPGQEVQFLNQSIDASTYLWDFGFTTSTQENPSITFDTPGTYEVSLTAYNECLCADETVITVEVNNADSPIIDCISTICAGDIGTYTSDVDCTAYNWDVSSNGVILDGGGSDDNFITIEWLDGPAGELTLDVGDCASSTCTLPTTMSVPIISNTANIYGYDQVCVDQVTTYSVPAYDATDFNWTVSSLGTIVGGQGTNQITVHWTSALSNIIQNVAVDYENCFLECGGSASLDVKILPEHYATGPLVVCQGADEIYEALSTQTNNSILANWSITDGTTELWNSGGAAMSPSINWNFLPGTYELNVEPLASSSFCTQTYSLQVTVVAQPLSPTNIEGANDICVGNAYTYQGISSEANIRFEWTINDGGTITEKSGNYIAVTWNSSGPYELTVIAITTDGNQCSSAPFTQSINAISNWDITGEADVCLDQISTFSAPYYDNVTYDWSISPASAGTIIDDPSNHSVDILWHETGVHTVNMNSCGNSSSHQIEVHELPTPVAIFPTDLCPGEVAAVMTTASYDTYEWKNEAGTIVSTLPSPNLQAGYYQVVVSNQYGCVGDTTFYINALTSIEANISTPAAEGQCPGPPSATIYALDVPSGYTYEWYQDGASIGMIGMNTININQYGTYQVLVTDVNGCSEFSNAIEIFDCTGITGTCPGGQCTCYAPNYNFDITPLAHCNERQYTNTSIAYEPGSIQWIFNDPDSGQNTATGEVVTHTYSKAGFYKVVILADYLGQTCYNYQVDTVHVAANFEVDNACPNGDVLFSDLSSFIPGTNITSWEWNFGDPSSGTNNTSTDQNPTHVFATEGTYDITLTVTTSTGCTSTITRAWTIFPPPSINIPDPIANCAQAATPLVAEVAPSVTYVSWNFGDPTSGDKNTSELFNTYHEYATAGNYTVTLTVEDIYGCTNSFSRTITIADNLLAGEINPPGTTSLCEGDSILLEAPAGGISWEWSTADTTESISVLEEGVYEVTITDADGCTYTPAAAIVAINPAPIVSSYAVEYDVYGNPINYIYTTYDVCEGEDVYLEVANNTDYSFEWSTTETTTTISFTEEKGNLLGVGTHDISVTATDNTTDCTSVDVITVNVHGLPNNLSISASNAGVICEGTSTTFSVTNPDANLSYLWSNGETGSTMTTAAAGEYYVVATTPYGCEAESNHLTIVEGPDISMIPNGCYDLCGTDTLCIPNIEGVTSFQWFLDDMPIPAPEGTISDLIVSTSGTYHVEMENSQGCLLTSGDLVLNIDGVGNIIGAVYADVDLSGDISAADTLVSGISIEYINTLGETGQQITTDQGAYDFIHITSSNYTLTLDENSLPNFFIPLWTTVDTLLMGCNDEIIVNWLIQEECPPNTIATNLSFCDGGNIEHNGITYTSAIDTTLTVVDPGGCEYQEHLVITTLPISTTMLTESVCPGETYNHFGDELGVGVHPYIYSAANGCDSLVTLTIEELEAIPLQEINLSFCEGENIVYNGITYDIPTSVVVTFPASNGCDSTVQVNIDMLPVAQTDLYIEICFGETYDYQGDMLTGGTYDYTYTAANGCDSLVNITIEEVDMITGSDINLSFCEGGSVDHNGTTYTTTTSFTETLTAVNGCDSMQTVNIEMLLPSQASLDINTCFGETITYQGQTLSGGQQQTFHYTAANGCDSTLTVQVIENTEIGLELDGSTICANGNDGTISATTTGSNTGLEYAIDGNTFTANSNFDNLTVGQYTITVQDNQGCEEQATVNINALPSLNANIQNDPFSCERMEANLAINVISGNDGNIDVQWSNGQTGPNTTINMPGLYTAIISNDCETITQSVDVQPSLSINAGRLFLPNAFSPNDDGINDEFLPLIGDGAIVESTHLVIFSRWGDLVFESSNIGEGWKGTFGGDIAKTGVYVWMLETTINVCGEVKKIKDSGEVTLLR